MLKHNLIANYFGQAWSNLIGILLIPIYIKYLGVESYGLIGIFALLQTCLLLMDMGITPTLNREMARFSAGASQPKLICNLLRSLEIISCLISLAIFGLVYVSSDWLSKNWLNSENISQDVMAQVICLMGLVVALRFMEGIYRGTLLGLQRQVLFNIANVTLSTIRAVGAVMVLDLISPSIENYFIWQIVISFISVFILAIIAWRSLPSENYRPRFSVASLKEVRHFAGGITLTAILSVLLTQIDKIILSKLVNLEVFGYYTLASTVAASLALIVGPITQAFYPRFNELVASNDNQALIKAYHLSAQLATVFMLPITIVLIFFGENLLQLWMGDSVDANKVAPILSLLVLGAFLNGLMHTPYMLQLAFGWTSFGVFVNGVAVVFLVPSVLWVAPNYGAVGVAWIWLTLNFCYLVISVHFMFRRLLPAEKWRWYWGDILLPILGVTPIAIAMYFIKLRVDSHLFQYAVILTFSFFIFIFALFFASQTRAFIIINIKKTNLNQLAEKLYSCFASKNKNKNKNKFNE
jgi:O-antigen/teichoic acid export membrane protein